MAGYLVGVLLVSTLGAAIGGSVMAYFAYQLGRDGSVWPQGGKDEDYALLEGFSLDLWRLYVGLVSSSEAPSRELDAASQRGLFLVARLRARADIEGAVSGMLGVLRKAHARAQEHRRIGLRIRHSQFVDLTQQISADFALLQMEAERLRLESRWSRGRSMPGSLPEFLRHHGPASSSRRSHDENRAFSR